ncbi:ParB N-terminal domain-containing protein [Microbacterium sp.]|uniref:ParB N-terminal domain-containing protein n=1 Tax=Microbacterium sp. TaxID=51671 RepID=UPI003C1D68B7
MAQTVGSPPQGEKVRAIVHERLQAARAEDGEKLTIEWRGVPSHRHVIAMPIELLYYNPDTHRIRAQRSLDPDRDARLSADPWGDDGQDYLDFLLKTQPSSPGKTDPEFEALRDSLDDFGQQQPGLITPDGILVNGNTRCAALRELGKRHIRVAVLPDDATRADVSSVELALQLRRENKRDYSYINQLIAIEEQLTHGRRPEEIAREFHIRTKTLEQDRWVYALIQEAIARSDAGEGATLRLVDFEDHQEKLRELYRAYTTEGATNRDAAEALKESRLALILLGFSKTDVRLAKPDFFEKYLEQKLPRSAAPLGESAVGPVDVSIPGLSVAVADDAAAVKQAREVTNRVLRARSTTRPGTTADPKKQDESTDFIQTLRESADNALMLAGRDERLRQRKVAAADRLSDATDAIGLATSDVAQALATKSIDEDSLDEALVSLRNSLLALARQIQRAVQDPGEGVAWLTQLEQGTA